MNSTLEVYEPPIEVLLKDPEPLIPEGTYHLKIKTWQTRLMFARCEKLHITFEIIDGEYAGVNIPYYCNVKQFLGKPRFKGRFVVGKKSKLAREFFLIMQLLKIDTTQMRLDRIPLTKLNAITAKVRTVKVVDKKQLPLAVRYSVIEEITGVCK